MYSISQHCLELSKGKVLLAILTERTCGLVITALPGSKKSKQLGTCRLQVIHSVLQAPQWQSKFISHRVEIIQEFEDGCFLRRISKCIELSYGKSALGLHQSNQPVLWIQCSDLSDQVIEHGEKILLQ